MDFILSVSIIISMFKSRDGVGDINKKCIAFMETNMSLRIEILWHGSESRSYISQSVDSTRNPLGVNLYVAKNKLEVAAEVWCIKHHSSPKPAGRSLKIVECSF